MVRVARDERSLKVKGRKRQWLRNTSGRQTRICGRRVEPQGRRSRHLCIMKKEATKTAIGERMGRTGEEDAEVEDVDQGRKEQTAKDRRSKRDW